MAKSGTRGREQGDRGCGRQGGRQDEAQRASPFGDCRGLSLARIAGNRLRHDRRLPEDRFKRWCCQDRRPGQRHLPGLGQYGRGIDHRYPRPASLSVAFNSGRSRDRPHRRNGNQFHREACLGRQGNDRQESPCQQNSCRQEGYPLHDGEEARRQEARRLDARRRPAAKTAPTTTSAKKPAAKKPAAKKPAAKKPAAKKTEES